MKKEGFEERHGDSISKLKLVLIVVCLIAIPVTFYVNHRDVGSVNDRVTRVESPCLRYGPASRLCKEAFEKAVLTITHAQACSILRKAGLEILNCKGARLGQEQARDDHVDAADDATKDHRGVRPSTGNSPPSPAGPPSGGPPGKSEPQSPGVSSPPLAPAPPGTDTPSAPPPSGTAPGSVPPPAPATPSRGPLAPVLTPITPPAAAPAVENVCEKAAAVAPLC